MYHEGPVRILKFLEISFLLASDSFTGSSKPFWSRLSAYLEIRTQKLERDATNMIVKNLLSSLAWLIPAAHIFCQLWKHFSVCQKAITSCQWWDARTQHCYYLTMIPWWEEIAKRSKQDSHSASLSWSHQNVLSSFVEYCNLLMMLIDDKLVLANSITIALLGLIFVLQLQLSEIADHTLSRHTIHTS